MGSAFRVSGLRDDLLQDFAWPCARSSKVSARTESEV